MDAERFQERYEAYRAAAEDYLAALFTEKTPYQALYDSMRYSLLSGGKRLRPVLTLECARLGGLGDWRDALPFACALELVHTYSLIHDDLPCMDDDDLRRGKPTNHVVFGETMATLAGDALQSEAYRLIAQAPGMSDRAKVDASLTLSLAAGADGMVAGQVLDLDGSGHDRASLTLLCEKKTCCMIRGAAELGCAASEADGALRRAVGDYALRLGLAFQIRDDMLDRIGDEKTLGKATGADEKQHKTTFVGLYGLDKCRETVHALTAQAADALAVFEDAGSLAALARQMEGRMY